MVFLVTKVKQFKHSKFLLSLTQSCYQEETAFALGLPNSAKQEIVKSRNSKTEAHVNKECLTSSQIDGGILWSIIL